MTKITKKGQQAFYVSDPKDIMKYLPNKPLTSMRMSGDARIMIYENEEYKIESTNKKKGIYAGDICTVCGMGEVVDAGGCATCNRCGAQLKCGL